MLSNLITSLLLSCCIGASSVMDRSTNATNDINQAVSVNNTDYVINGFFTTFKNTGFNFTGLNGTNVPNFTFYFTPNYELNGFITGSYYLYNQSVGIYGKHQQIIEQIRFQFQYSSGNQNYYCSVNYYIYDLSTQSYKWDTNYSHNPYIAVKNCYLTSFEDFGYNTGYTTDEFLERYFYNVNNMRIGDLNNNFDVDNPYFYHLFSNCGGYAFSYDFNPWLSWFSNPSSTMIFGVPNQEVFSNQSYFQLNVLNVPSDDVDNYFIDNRNSPWELFSFDIFEGLFSYGGQYFTNIRLYFSSINEEVVIGDDYLSVEYYYNQFVYASFVNTATDSEYVFLLTDGYKHYTNDFYKWENTGVYNPSLSVIDNYRNINNHMMSLNAVAYTNLRWVSMPYIKIIYSLNRPTNDYGFRSGSSFNDLIGFIPGADNGDSPSGNTLNTLSNVFFLVRLTFDSILPLLNTQILPGLSLSALLFTPIVFVIILAVIKLFKR